MPEEEIVRREEILQIGKDYPPLGRLIQDNQTLDWTHVMMLAVKTLFGIIKSLSDIVKDERKRRKAAEYELSTLKQERS